MNKYTNKYLFKICNKGYMHFPLEHTLQLSMSLQPWSKKWELSCHGPGVWKPLREVCGLAKFLETNLGWNLGGFWGIAFMKRDEFLNRMDLWKFTPSQSLHCCPQWPSSWLPIAEVGPPNTYHWWLSAGFMTHTSWAAGPAWKVVRKHAFLCWQTWVEIRLG